jgi:dihydrodipicolinate synthase/N-acetylneuraminate lyase
MRDFYLFERIANIAQSVVGKRLNMLSGADECQVMGMAAGADGAIGSFYNLMPKTFVELRAAFSRGETSKALEMQTRGNRVIEEHLTIGTACGKLSAIAAMKHVMRELQGLPAGQTKKRYRGDVYTDEEHGAACVAKMRKLGEEYKIE